LLQGSDRWETLGREYAYRGRLVRVRLDTVRLPTGRDATWEVVEHPAAVAILAVEAGAAVLVRQYRHVVGQELLEVPAGLLKPGEDPLEGARRELAEEAGCRARVWEPALRFYTSPGFTDEVIHLFIARDLEWSQSRPDRHEFIRVVRLPRPQWVAAMRDGRIRDAKTITALLWALAEDGFECN